MSGIGYFCKVLTTGFALALSIVCQPAPVKAAIVVASCGGLSLPANSSGQDVYIDTTGNLCSAASVSASVSGFAPNGSYATLTAGAASADATLPTGTVVAVHNTGTSAVSCHLAVGATSASANRNVIQPSSWFGFTVGSNTHIACIDQTGSVSNTVVIAGGAGLPTGSGGGGGGSGGAVTMASGAVASGAYSSGSIASGAMVDLGAVADAAATAGSTGTVSAKLRLMTSQLDQISTTVAAINTNVQAAIPAGTNAIGIVAVRQNNQIKSPVISGTSAISASAVAAQGSGVRFAMTDFSCSNSGSSNTIVHFLDGNAAGALPIWTAMVPATGGNNKFFQTPVSTTANTALIISSLTASTTVYCSVSGYSGT